MRKWFENRNPFQNCDWIESNRRECVWGVARAHSTRYIYEWWEPIWAACEIEQQMFPRGRESSVYHRHHLSIVCVMLCCVALAVVTWCSKINEVPEAVAHLTCGIRLSNQNKSFRTLQTTQAIVYGNKLHPHPRIETLVETQNTAQCVFFASKFRLFVCFDLVSVRILHSLQLTHKTIRQNFKRTPSDCIYYGMQKNFPRHPLKINCHN